MHGFGASSIAQARSRARKGACNHRQSAWLAHEDLARVAAHSDALWPAHVAADEDDAPDRHPRLNRQFEGAMPEGLEVRRCSIHSAFRADRESTATHHVLAHARIVRLLALAIDAETRALATTDATLSRFEVHWEGSGEGAEPVAEARQGRQLGRDDTADEGTCVSRIIL